MTLTVLIGIVVLSVLILTHELGHFITAKSAGVKVEEFGLGFPPRLVSFKRGETRYSLNIIPFGGFTKLLGEENPAEPRSLASKSQATRLLVLSAGSLMNLLLALILFSAVYLFPSAATTGQVVVEKIAPNSPAAAAGIIPGDIVLSVDNQPMDNSEKLYQYIMANQGNPVTFLIQHVDSTTGNIQVTPRLNPPEGEGAVGIATSTLKRYPLWQVIPMGAKALFEALVMWATGLVSIFSGTAPAAFLGPVGLVQLTGEVAGFGIISLLRISAYISLILGIMNLLPLPAIDGGRIAFVLLEWIRRGKRISAKTEGIVHFVGLVMFLLLFLAVTYQDIGRIISGGSPLP